MRCRLLPLFVLVAVLLPAVPHLAAATDRAAVTASLQKIADDYLSDNAATEGATALSISVSLPGGAGPNINVVSGKVSRDENAPAVTPDTLFPIGSITKSMTSVIVLQLVEEGVLSLDAPIGRWLPEYPAWSDVTLRRLLDMTSGIPSYDQTDAFMASLVRDGIDRHYTKEVLISFTDPALPGAPKPTTGFDYSNVNYIIAQLILERVTGRSLDALIGERLLSGGRGLDDTYYASGPYPDSVMSRTVSCYMTQSDAAVLQPLVGADFKAQDPSWAQAAGSAIATVEDVTRWVRLLFEGNVLTPAARQELIRLVSMSTGKPVDAATPEDDRAFGLGVGQTIVGGVRFWFYEGEPMGNRVFYGYFPDRDLVIAVGVNSAADNHDALGRALIAMYEAVTGETVVLPAPKP